MKELKKRTVIVKELTKLFETKERKGIFKKGKKKRIVAVNRISFDVYEGEIFGLLGPNGAGKTTTIKMLSTLLLPDNGEAWVNGYHIIKEADEVRKSIGVSLYSDRGFYWKLTGRENLRYFAYLYHISPSLVEKRINELLKIVGLYKDADKLVEEYSTGMKSKLNFARALINNPKIIFLDEPTIGLDPNSARIIRNAILKLRKEGRTILLTTHNMEEADILCDRIAIINHGKIIALGTSEELKSMIKRKNFIEVEVSNITNEVIKRIRKIDEVSTVTYSIKDPVSLTGYIKIGLNGNSRGLLPMVLKNLFSLDIKIRFIKPSEPSLEDVFVSLTGRAFHEEEENA